MSGLFLLALCAHVVLGNLARVLPNPVPGIQSAIPISEIILYGLMLPAALSSRAALLILARVVVPVAAIVFFFALVGTLRFGLHAEPLLYAVRVLALVGASVVAGHTLLRRYGTNALGVLAAYSMLFGVSYLLSFLIFVSYPDSTQLWRALAAFGVQFGGDPHQGRLVSPYLDPNFFAAIAGLPVLMSWLTYRFLRHRLFLLLTVLGLAAIVFTGSRSGVAALSLLVAYGLFSEVRHRLFVRSLRVTTVVAATLTVAVGSALVAPSLVAVLARTLSRIASVASDPSAGSRLDAFALGWEIISRFPILGVGYNFVPLYIPNARPGLYSLDSSLQILMASFGVVGTSLIVGLTVLPLVRACRALRNPGVDADAWPIHVALRHALVYLVVTALFTSQFNDVLFYSFWITATLPLIVYLVLAALHVARRRADPGSGPL